MVTVTLTKEQKEIIEKVRDYAKQGFLSSILLPSELVTLITAASDQDMWKVIEKIAAQNVDKEVEKQTFNDMLVYGECMIHIDENGKEKRIKPYSEEYYTVKEKQSVTEALEKSTRHILWNKEADKEAEEYINQQPKHAFSMPIYEDSNYLLKVRIRELEEQIVTYCRENPAAEEWFGITVNR